MTAYRDAPNAPGWIDEIDNPYLHGIHAPTTVETVSHDLPVEGELPEDLAGTYLRNGPNARVAPSNLYHWFDGDGMVHSVQLHGGKATYRNRYVRTAGFLGRLKSP